jgi:hypothetical protein
LHSLAHIADNRYHAIRLLGRGPLSRHPQNDDAGVGARRKAQSVREVQVGGDDDAFLIDGSLMNACVRLPAQADVTYIDRVLTCV